MFGHSFIQEPKQTCPRDGFTGIPWYSCENIEKLSDVEKRNIIMKSITIPEIYPIEKNNSNGEKN